jgi:HK97 family phage major capsid protein
VAALPQYADGNARFICSRVAKALVFDPLLRAGGGNNKSDIAGRMLNTYLGYPIEIAQKMPAGVATDYNNLPMILFGDLSAAVSMGTRRGVTVQVLNELYAANGQIGVIASERFDINVHDVGTSSAAGPLVALMGSSS